jgi:hypothetical protein
MPAGSTYTPIATTTLGSAVATVTFSSISGSYTDLVLISNIKGSTGNNTRMTFNNDASALYSNTALSGSGTTAFSRRDSGVNSLRLDWESANPTTDFNIHITNVQNYANTTTFKTALTRSGAAAYGTDALVGLYRSTSAITRLDVITTSGNFAIGSTFTLYGIASA